MNECLRTDCPYYASCDAVRPYGEGFQLENEATDEDLREVFGEVEM